MSAAGPTARDDLDATTPAPGRKKKRGCLAQGCLALLGLLTLMVVLVGALLLRVPQQFGFWPSGARLLDGTPDRASAATIMAQLNQAGVDSTSLTLYILPVEGLDGTLAYAVLDAGFHFPSSADANPLLDLFTRLASGPTVEAAGIEQVAIEYRDADGRRLGVLTASTDTIRRFIDGQIDEQAFSAQLHGDVDVAAVLQAVNGQ